MYRYISFFPFYPCWTSQLHHGPDSVLLRLRRFAPGCVLIISITCYRNSTWFNAHV
ncbi:hypothetical protein Hanom_Chr07g00600401 [Helianthus anomalus]